MRDLFVIGILVFNIENPIEVSSSLIKINVRRRMWVSNEDPVRFINYGLVPTYILLFSTYIYFHSGDVLLDGRNESKTKE